MNDAYHCDDEHIIWARGPQCWGRGKTRGQAIAFARKAKPSWIKSRVKWQISLTPINSEIDLMDGYLSWTSHTCNVDECRSHMARSKPKPEAYMADIFGK